jgi:hypothetical protein
MHRMRPDGQLNFYLRVLMRDRLSHQNRSLMRVSKQCYLTHRCHPATGNNDSEWEQLQRVGFIERLVKNEHPPSMSA